MLLNVFKNEGQGSDVWPYDKPQYLILNIAIGGAWGGQKGIDDTIFPQRMYVDYVRIYQEQGATMTDSAHCVKIGEWSEQDQARGQKSEVGDPKPEGALALTSDLRPLAFRPLASHWPRPSGNTSSAPYARRAGWWAGPRGPQRAWG